MSCLELGTNLLDGWGERNNHMMQSDFFLKASKYWAKGHFADDQVLSFKVTDVYQLIRLMKVEFSQTFFVDILVDT